MEPAWLAKAYKIRWERWAMFRDVVGVTTVLASLCVVATAVATAFWWTYRRGQESVRKYSDLELRRMAERLADLERETNRLRGRSRWRKS